MHQMETKQVFRINLIHVFSGPIQSNRASKSDPGQTNPKPTRTEGEEEEGGGGRRREAFAHTQQQPSIHKARQSISGHRHPSSQSNQRSRRHHRTYGRITRRANDKKRSRKRQGFLQQRNRGQKAGDRQTNWIRKGRRVWKKRTWKRRKRANPDISWQQEKESQQKTRGNKSKTPGGKKKRTQKPPMTNKLDLRGNHYHIVDSLYWEASKQGRTMAGERSSKSRNGKEKKK
ncbi:hypothetical protein HDK77DRAFT_185701 [Phyllosticta capitalensis]